jgi:hypothetical protein
MKSQVGLVHEGIGSTLCVVKMTLRVVDNLGVEQVADRLVRGHVMGVLRCGI